MSVRIFNDEPYKHREVSAFVCMDGGAFEVGERLDASAYCLDAIDDVPAGSARRFESNDTGDVYVVGRLWFR